MSRPVDRVLAALRGVRETSSGWLARCPAHADRDPSLMVGEGDDGRVLLHCHAGCATEDVVRALGLEMNDLFPSEERPPKTTREDIDRERKRRKSERRPKRTRIRPGRGSQLPFGNASLAPSM